MVKNKVYIYKKKIDGLISQKMLFIPFRYSHRKSIINFFFFNFLFLSSFLNQSFDASATDETMDSSWTSWPNKTNM